MRRSHFMRRGKPVEAHGPHARARRKAGPIRPRHRARSRPDQMRDPSPMTPLKRRWPSQWRAIRICAREFWLVSSAPDCAWPGTRPWPATS
jgi:hypothetical protein